MKRGKTGNVGRTLIRSIMSRLPNDKAGMKESLATNDEILLDSFNIKKQGNYIFCTAMSV